MKDDRYPIIKDGLGHYKGAKVNERKVVKGKEVIFSPRVVILVN